jgi:hypothetical protein
MRAAGHSIRSRLKQEESTMNPVHLHLMLTHVPVLGTVFALLLLGVGLLRHSDEIKKLAFCAFAIFAAFAIPVFLTGEPAEKAVEHLSGVSEAVIETHEEAATIAFGVILSLGSIALGGLAFIRRRPVPQWFGLFVLTLAIATSGLLGWTANLGGKVRHTEIRAEASPRLSPASGERD